MITSGPSKANTRSTRIQWFAALLACALMVPLAAHAVSSVQIQVPVRTAPDLQLSAVRVTLQLSDPANTIPANIALSITDSDGTNHATVAMDLNSNSNDCSAAGCFFDFATPAGSDDSVTVIKPKHADPLATDLTQIVLMLEFPRVNTAGCTAGISANETWTIAVVGGADRIAGVAVQSLDKQTATACGTAYRPVPLDDTPFAQALAPAAVISGRVGIDAAMVLDHSGSMSSRVNPADLASQTKISLLHSAAGIFLDTWAQLRTNETALQIQSPVDKAGVVFFDHDAQWLQTLVPASQIDGVKPFTSLVIANEKTNISSVAPAGATSIGDGLALAAAALPGPAGTPSRQAILLMSDGIQNSSLFAQVTGPQVQTTVTSGGAATSLANQPPIKIYSVTVGTGTAVDPTINQAVATASGGFYLNYDPALSATDFNTVLNNFFVQVLQNMHRYSTVETQRIISDQASPEAPFSTQFPVTSTTTSLALSTSWSDPRTRLRVQLIPPGTTQPIEFVPTGSAGTLTGGVTFPRQGLAQSAGLWTVRVVVSGEGSRKVPFDLMLLADDAALNSSLGVVTAEHAVGGSVKLTAQINDFGKPLKGLNTQPNARVEAFVVRPGASLGDVLSASAVTPPPPAATDASSDAQRKLEALLEADPNALQGSQNSVTLVDDGSAAHGDERADDGRYSALVPAEVEGHYQVVFFVEGDSASGGRFVRQQIRTVHVRSLPDTTNTGVTTQVTTGDGGGVLTAVLTPKNVKNQMMGPGYANYFWFMPVGGTPVKGIDNLNGTYTATIPFTGSPPKVSVHFLPEPVFRADDFVPAPEVLTPGNTVVDDVNKDKDKPWWLKWWWLILLLLILLIIWLLRRRSP